MGNPVKMIDSQLADIGTPGIVRPLPDLVCASTWLPEILAPPDPVLIDTLDRGCKCMVVGPSKSRKTFFMVQMAASLAAGESCFLGWDIPKARRVLFVNLEVQPYHMHRRLFFVCDALKVDPDALDSLHIWNLRGHQVGFHRLEEIREQAREKDAEVVMFDPMYKLHDGDENKAQDVKPVLRMFDQLCEGTGATVFYSHHDAKGVVSDRPTIDRGAGSNVIARDFDTAFYLADHAEDGLQVVQTICRAYPPQDAVSIQWEDGAFHLSGETPVLRPRKQSNRLGPAPTEQDAVDLVMAEPMPITKYHEQLRTSGFTERRARAMRDDLTSKGALSLHKERVFHGVTWIGMPDHIRAKQEKNESE